MAHWRRWFIGGGAAAALFAGYEIGHISGPPDPQTAFNLEVDCANGGSPNVAIANGLNTTQEITIGADEGGSKIYVTAHLGEYSLRGGKERQWDAGTIIARFGVARIVAGEPKNPTSREFKKSAKHFTLACNNVFYGHQHMRAVHISPTKPKSPTSS